MSCDNCTDKEKAEQQQKLITDARKQAEEKQAPVAICYDGQKGYWFADAREAYLSAYPIVQIISHLQ